MIYCKQCGKQIGDNEKFCPYCGGLQQNESPVVQPIQEQSKQGGGAKNAFMVTANCINAVALAFIYFFGINIIRILYDIDYAPVLFAFYLLLFFAVIAAFVFGILCKHKMTLFVSVFTLSSFILHLLILASDI